MEINAILHTLGITGVLGALVFLTTLIVEVTKNIPGIKKIPTQIWTIVIAMVVCILAVSVYYAVTGLALVWYVIPLAVVGAFIVAYISMFGWDTFMELWNRLKPKK